MTRHTLKLAACCLGGLFALAAPYTQPQAAVRVANPDDNFTLREAMIPMRDGVELHTLILIPKDAKQALPMLLTRTPYGAAGSLAVKERTSMHAVLDKKVAELEGYIFVFQDIRGRNGSGGEFVLQRPPKGEFNNTNTDETTDAWDTVDWLVKNVPGNNGRVGIFGTSYSGWTTLMALLDPHPALKVAIPVNPAVDFWMGDDWFHNGAFRPAYAFEYVHALQSDANSWTPFAFNHYDTYVWWLNAGSPDQIGQRYLDPSKHLYWWQLTQHPTYDAYWQASALDPLLKKSRAALVPTMHVHGWFDQEDIYGAPAAYSAMEARDTGNDRNYFVAGPWFHGQSWGTGDRLGALVWDQDTAKRWREDMLAPFLGQYLRDGASHKVAPVEVFNTGTHRWEKFTAWPLPPATQARSLYLQPGHSVSWQAPTASKGTGDSYVSDPAKPVPYQQRPIRRIYDDPVGYPAWRTWLVADQRFVDGRPDVLTYVSEPLQQSVTVRGAVTARLFAQTTGTDADWVVKLIDVYPDQDASQYDMSGYQFMVSGNILRARFREGFTEARPVAANRPLEYSFELPQVNHTFKPGHRLMVQVQSSWFPLYDRNPQKFLPSIMAVQPGDYQVATQTIHTSKDYPSQVELSVAVP